MSKKVQSTIFYTNSMYVETEVFANILSLPKNIDSFCDKNQHCKSNYLKTFFFEVLFFLLLFSVLRNLKILPGKSVKDFQWIGWERALEKNHLDWLNYFVFETVAPPIHSQHDNKIPYRWYPGREFSFCHLREEKKWREDTRGPFCWAIFTDNKRNRSSG